MAGGELHIVSTVPHSHLLTEELQEAYCHQALSRVGQQEAVGACRHEVHTSIRVLTVSCTMSDPGGSSSHQSGPPSKDLVHSHVNDSRPCAATGTPHWVTKGAPTTNSAGGCCTCIQLLNDSSKA
jgi:hypothetical protein